FTSGSTGAPKGVLIPHSSISTAVTHQRFAICMPPHARVYDFAAHAFDMHHWSVFHTLAAGATLCTPSDRERREDLAGSMRRFGATMALLTPSVARVVEPGELESLEVVHLGGERLTQKDWGRWVEGRKGTVKVVNAYGPSETTQAVLYGLMPSDPVLKEGEELSMGKGVAVCTWIVDPESGERLVEVGEVGELYIEGPLVGKGYLNDPDKTAKSFVESPGWLRKGSPDGRVKGRSKSRLYKTGDLVRYNPADGTLVFVGRKDTQVKLRGQRIELVRVEHAVQQVLAGKLGKEAPPVVAEVLVSSATNSQVLVAFVETGLGDVQFEDWVDGLQDALGEQLPPYMVPATFIPVETMPLATSGKTDRQALRQLGSRHTLEELAAMQPQGAEARRSPSTEMEKRLQALWSSVLEIEPDSISADSSFFRIGGESIAAMRLVGMARREGWLLSVAEVFEYPTLEEIAKIIRRNEDESGEDDAVLPFSLLDRNQDIKLACQRAASLCGVEGDDVEDIFPCTALQEGLLALTMKQEGSYTSRNVLRLAYSVDVGKFREAWDNVVVAIPILRTRIVDLDGQGLVQVVVRDHSQSWIEARDTEEYLTQESELPMGLGTPLMRCAIIVPQVNSQESAFFALTLHHSLYDGFTLPIVMETLEAFYNGLALPHLAPFQSFVKHIGTRDKNAETKFWRSQFAGLKAAPFPALPSPTYEPQSNSTLVHTVDGIAWRTDNITPSTVIRAASALLCSLHTSPTSPDIVFGAVSSGRKAPVPGIETLPGPTIATVPIRVKTNNDRKILELLTSIQTQETQMIRYEQTGLSSIRQLGEEAQLACQFQTLVVVQAPQEENTKSGLFVSEDAERTEAEEEAHYRGFQFQSYALSLICTPEEGHLKVRFCFDSNVLEREKVQRMSRNFEQLLRTLCSSSNDEISLGAISLTSNEDLDRIW
ncbi:hypothetical protein N0V85_009521, partial [Neurospora sp. IMI 360204]